MSNLKDLDRHPPVAVDTLQQFRWALANWLWAADDTITEVRQEIAVAACSGRRDDLEPMSEMPLPRQARCHVVAGVAADCKIGLRAAQKRLKKQGRRFEEGGNFIDGGHS